MQMIGGKIIEEFLSLGLIKEIPDIFKLKREDIMHLDGFGEKSADNLMSAIANSRTVSFSRFIYSLGIVGVGEETSKDIASAYTSIDDLANTSFDTINELFGVGEKIAQSVVSWFTDSKNKKFLNSLLKEVTIIYTQDEVTNQLLAGKTFVLTGTLNALSREQAKEYIEKSSGKVSSSVSKKTFAVVVGSDPGSKYEEALKLGVQILNEESFLALINIRQSPK
jgi:DNA ligase (NAD+)